MEGSDTKISDSDLGVLAAKSKLSLASLVSLVLGPLVYASGAILSAYSYHRIVFFSVGEDVAFFRDWYERGQWVKEAGVILFMLGVALYVMGRRKVALSLARRKP